MSELTNISWTDRTWNPWWGCTKVSEACRNCYAENAAWRYKSVGWGAGSLRALSTPKVWDSPFVWNEYARRNGTRKRVFCLSMGDFFDAEVPAEWREQAWNVIRVCNALEWQILTKRPENILSMLPSDWGLGWDHVWLGCTAENQACADERIPILLDVPAAIRFLSCEPLLGPLSIPRLSELDWIIVGGESGPGFRTMDPDWVRSVRDQCRDSNVAFHFKQWGTTRPKLAGRVLDGVTWDSFPREACALPF